MWEPQGSRVSPRREASLFKLAGSSYEGPVFFWKNENTLLKLAGRDWLGGSSGVVNNAF